MYVDLSLRWARARCRFRGGLGLGLGLGGQLRCDAIGAAHGEPSRGEMSRVPMRHKTYGRNQVRRRENDTTQTETPQGAQ